MRDTTVFRLPIIVAAFLALLAAAAPAAAAETIQCPMLSGATQVEACPTDEQLRYRFIGFCSDNRRLYDGEVEGCSHFETFRRLKNVALWEAGPEGAFQGYLSCELPRERIAAAVPRAVTVSRLRNVTRVSCSYGEGLSLTLRTKAICTVQGDGLCAADAAACRVGCN
jgi:hypothetical protein